MIIHTSKRKKTNKLGVHNVLKPPPIKKYEYVCILRKIHSPTNKTKQTP